MKKFLVVFVALNFMVVHSPSSSSLDLEELRRREEGVRIWRRGLKSFKEKATGTNTTFDCSPSGPCVPCLYHEKKDVSYRCSETGYRIPMRCVKIAVVDEEKGSRNLLEDSSTIQVGPEMYVTYRSCIPAVNEEKLSLIGFEAIMLLLLISSSFVIFRRKGSLVMPGAIRLPTNPRF
ncbi:hypothetical protein HanPI659440_Chr08g0278451 [Helianthus annuus]|nr:hypothetical protein HanPI659440_Chr08g0278451 [Helianthus annuus]